MKILKRALSSFLALIMLISVIPSAAFAQEQGEYKISNSYMSFSFNEKTGGFSIETIEGHPQKILDNNIPLLYEEDKERSNGTSFVTVRIDDEDYIFGQDYGFLGLSSKLETPIVEEEGRLIKIPWTIKDVTITMEAALDNNENSSTTGNVGLAFTVDNNSGKDREVSVRLLLDTALGDRIDAPYFVVGEEEKATLTETEFSGEELGNINQIRCVDSLSNPTRLAYMMLYGFSAEVKTPNRVILGHWANLANTRYSYMPDSFCDFSNYSNSYRVPDSAAAVYWEGFKLGSNEDNKSFRGELLYGVGSFSRSADCPVGIDITAGRVELEENKATGEKSYAYRDANGNVNHDGFDVTITIDNTLDDSVEMSNVYVNISADEGKLSVPEGYRKQGSFQLKKGDIKTFSFKMKATEQNDLTAGTFYVTLSGSTVAADGSTKDFEAAAERSVILPSVGKVSEIQMNKINPETVYTDGEKVVTVSGKMEAVQALLADNARAELVLYNETAKHSVSVQKDKIAFIDDTYETMSFTTEEALYVGEYSIMFKIKDADLKSQLGGNDTITCDKKLKVSADEKYRIKSYGLIALVRSLDNKAASKASYDFYSFDYESEFLSFYNGEASAKGKIGGKALKYNFGASEEAIIDHEVLLTVRGKLVQGVDANNNPYWQAEYANGDIIINNMLSYEGDKPLKISVSKDKNAYTVEGDGLIKVIDSINVWRYQWSIGVDTDNLYTLDAERLLEKAKGDALQGKIAALTLKLGGAASLVQTIGGFAVSLKYGELSSEWHKNSDGMVTYGIGFGGKISLPIKAKKKSTNPKDTTGTGSEGEQPNVIHTTAYAHASDAFGESDVETAMVNMFGAAEALEWSENHRNEGNSGNITGTSGTTGNTGSTGGTGGTGGTTGGTATGSSLTSGYGTNSAERTTTGDVVKKDDDLPDGSLSTEVNNVLFGEKYNDSEKKVSGTGFVGIDTKVSLEMPENVLGSFVTNAPGIKASVTINTIDNVYEVEAGVNMKIIECEGVLAFKQVEVKKKDVILPDKIEFYIRDGLKLPIAAPVLFMTGLGGGVNGLADTIGGEFDELPPITILLYTKLEAITVLEGEFNAKISLEEMSLDGKLQLSYEGLEKVMRMDAGIYARWIEPWELSLYGNVNIIDGLIKGGITVTIADNYFYGYVYASLCIPNSIPLVGGKTLGGVEAAVSHEFIGANIKIIGIKFGVKYYWGENVSFGSNIDLSAPPKSGESGTYMANDTSSPYAIGYYGTNVYALSASARTVTEDSSYYTVKENIQNADGKFSLLLEIPYEGEVPNSGDIELYNPGNEKIDIISEGENANMLIQNREDGDFIYISVTDGDKIGNGEWKLKYKKDSDFEITSFNVNAVDDIPELDKNATVLKSFDASDKDNMSVTVSWDYTTTDLAGKTGTVDVYLTEDKDILEKISTSNNTGDTLGTSIYHEEVSLSKKEATITLPSALPSGTYYVLTTLTTGDGISLAISKSAKTFTNPNLPKSVSAVKISYGGNGEIFVVPTDEQEIDYTHYIAQIVDEKGVQIENGLGQFEKGKNFTFGKEALLREGKKYTVEIKTLREEYKSLDGGKTYKTYYYYGSETVKSNTLTMPKVNTPRLLSAKLYTNTTTKTEIALSEDEINISEGDVIVEYKFDQPVFVEMDLNDGKVYAYGKNPSIDEMFRTDWTFVLDDLDDGDYIVDFTAFNKQKDSILGSKLSDTEGAYFAFTVDTSAPVLSLAQRVEASLSGEVMKHGANTVFADDDGNYVIEGITEKTAILKLDGKPMQNVTMDQSGSFRIEGSLDEGQAFVTHTITAEDKAGNEAKMNVSAVRKSGFGYDGLELYANGNTITPNKDGDKVLTVKNGSTVQFTAYTTANGKKMPVADEELDWSVLYAKNAVVLSEGNVTALTPGETAIKAKLITASLSGGAARNDGFSDYVIINITNNNKDDLAAKIAEANALLENTPNASETKKTAFKEAIKSARSVVQDSSATEETCTDAFNSLTSAMAEFVAPEPSDEGTGSGGGGGGGAGTAAYTVSVEKTENGTVKLSQTRVTRGNSLTITAIPDEGYTVEDMLINGKSVGRNEIYTVSSVTENLIIKVVFAEKSTELPFEDVIKGDWYYEYVKAAYEKNYMNGMSKTEFEPELTLTRAMFVTVLHRIDGEIKAGENHFTDVAEDAYYRNAVAWASANGIVNGISDTEFAPEENITREQMAAILYRYAQYKKLDVTVGDSTNILSYKDFDEISEYAISAMQYTAGSGLIVGKTDSTLNPQDTATRAEAATVFVRFADMLK